MGSKIPVLKQGSQNPPGPLLSPNGRAPRPTSGNREPCLSPAKKLLHNNTNKQWKLRVDWTASFPDLQLKLESEGRDLSQITLLDLLELDVRLMLKKNH